MDHCKVAIPEKRVEDVGTVDRSLLVPSERQPRRGCTRGSLVENYSESTGEYNHSTLCYCPNGPTPQKEQKCLEQTHVTLLHPVWVITSSGQFGQTRKPGGTINRSLPSLGLERQVRQN